MDDDPAYELEVQGSISNYGDGKIIRLRSNDYIIGQIENKGTGANYDKGYFRLFDTGTAKVVIDSAGDSYFNGGNFGIGATPAATLHVLASSPEFRLATTSSAVVRLRTSGDNYINTGQNLGIGTNGPTNILHTYTSSNTVGRFESSDGDAHIRINDNADSVYVGTQNQKGYIGGLAGNNNSNLTIDLTNGNVSIGTTISSAKLHVKSASTDSWAVLATASDGSNLGGIYEAGDGAGVLVAKDAGGTNKVYLDGQGSSYINGGNFGIGVSNPSRPLQIGDGSSGNVDANGDAIYLRGDTSLGAFIQYVRGGQYNWRAGISSGSYFQINDVSQSNATRLSIAHTTGYVQVHQRLGIGTAAPDNPLKWLEQIAVSKYLQRQTTDHI